MIRRGDGGGMNYKDQGKKRKGVLVAKKEERGRAFQTQRSVVEGEEQRELMWTKGRAKKKGVHARTREIETEERKRIGNRGGKRWTMPSDGTHLSFIRSQAKDAESTGLCMPKFDRTSHPPALMIVPLSCSPHSILLLLLHQPSGPHVVFIADLTRIMLSSGCPFQRKQAKKSLLSHPSFKSGTFFGQGANHSGSRTAFLPLRCSCPDIPTAGAAASHRGFCQDIIVLTTPTPRWAMRQQRGGYPKRKALIFERCAVTRTTPFPFFFFLSSFRHRHALNTLPFCS